ncbi:unnamed protein product [Gordionus sp. m RMFG-2023]
MDSENPSEFLDPKRFHISGYNNIYISHIHFFLFYIIAHSTEDIKEIRYNENEKHEHNFPEKIPIHSQNKLLILGFNNLEEYKAGQFAVRIEESRTIFRFVLIYSISTKYTPRNYSVKICNRPYQIQLYHLIGNILNIIVDIKAEMDSTDDYLFLSLNSFILFHQYSATVELIKNSKIISLFYKPNESMDIKMIKSDLNSDSYDVKIACSLLKSSYDRDCKSHNVSKIFGVEYLCTQKFELEN